MNIFFLSNSSIKIILRTSKLSLKIPYRGPQGTSFSCFNLISWSHPRRCGGNLSVSSIINMLEKFLILGRLFVKAFCIFASVTARSCVYPLLDNFRARITAAWNTPADKLEIIGVIFNASIFPSGRRTKNTFFSQIRKGPPFFSHFADFHTMSFRRIDYIFSLHPRLTKN